jgi:hypothetical protein
MTEKELLAGLLYYRVKDYEVQKRRDSGNFVVPHGRTTMEFLGAIARVARRKQSFRDVYDQAEFILRCYGDRGWSQFIVDPEFGAFFQTQFYWPFYLDQWSEQDIAETIKLAKLEGLTAEPHNYFHMTDKAFNDDERRLLWWLGSNEKSMKLYALANWWRGNKVPFGPQGVSHFRFAWNTLMGFPEKTDPDVFRTIRHLDIEGLQDYRMSLINGSRRTLAGN